MMASRSSKPREELVASRERRSILQAYKYFKKEEQAGGSRFKINTVLKKKTSEATGYPSNVIRAVRKGELKTSEEKRKKKTN